MTPCDQIVAHLKNINDFLEAGNVLAVEQFPIQYLTLGPEFSQFRASLHLLGPVSRDINLMIAAVGVVRFMIEEAQTRGISLGGWRKDRVCSELHVGIEHGEIAIDHLFGIGSFVKSGERNH